jgi:hypothetical protein
MVCDGDRGCGKEFRVSRPSVDHLADGVERTYFRCPHCEKVFVAFYTDREIRDKQKAIRRVANPHLVEKMRKEIAADMSVLRKRIEG